LIEHEWREAHEHSEGFEARGCPICGLRDRRKEGGPWKVDWPCIEPVPEEIAFEVVRDELAVHSPRIWLPHVNVMRPTSFAGSILCHGVPGKWRVGLATGNGFPYVFTDLKFYRGILIHWPISGTVASVEEGFGLLLRAMRAREYNPFLMSGFSYAKRLARHEYMPSLED